MHLFFSTRVCIASSERLWNKVLYKVNRHSFVSRVHAKALSRGEKNACQINWMGLVCLHKFIPLIYFNFSALCAHMQKSTQECMCAVLVKKIHLHQVLCALACSCAAVCWVASSRRSLYWCRHIWRFINYTSAHNII